ncbi:transposase [Canicola haemoglobinophilus]|uniref:Transposase n=1 Tax=Canicola haemoglobinophilus TaxID=733 RepID=A0AB38HAV0_9PAST|nr:IS1595 family transposase [Canicola haemoglobinophilus]STO54226.1 transposase [Canicola haemoglobinophilus]STO68759.1 transposase [Canicola haemoglobinophilus]
MAQYFLLTSKARLLSPIKIAQLSDDETLSMLSALRWESDNEQVCPKCGVKHQAYFISTRKQWRCKHCKHTFSITSGTIFANHKLPLQTYLFAIALFVNAVKGISACQLSRDLNVQYKTAFTLAHKIRESLMVQRELFPLSGEVHIDGTYVHSAPRPKNKKSERVDRRLKAHANPNKRAVLVMRERYSEQDTLNNPNLVGAKKTITFPILSENTETVKKLATAYIERNSCIHADENSAYDELIVDYDLQRVNHQREYRSDDGITNNLAESYFARFKRMYYGQVHKMSNLYLDNYANEIAYREDTRKQDNLTLFNDVISKCLNTSSDNDWKGYWQGHHRQVERLVM